MANDLSCEERTRSLAVVSGRASHGCVKSLGIGLPAGYQRLPMLLTAGVFQGGQAASTAGLSFERRVRIARIRWESLAQAHGSIST